jgi:hypothetical protein
MPATSKPQQQAAGAALSLKRGQANRAKLKGAPPQNAALDQRGLTQRIGQGKAQGQC